MQDIFVNLIIININMQQKPLSKRKPVMKPKKRWSPACFLNSQSVQLCGVMDDFRNVDTDRNNDSFSIYQLPSLSMDNYEHEISVNLVNIHIGYIHHLQIFLMILIPTIIKRISILLIFLINIICLKIRLSHGMKGKVTQFSITGIGNINSISSNIPCSNSIRFIYKNINVLMGDYNNNNDSKQIFN